MALSAVLAALALAAADPPKGETPPPADAPAPAAPAQAEKPHADPKRVQYDTVRWRIVPPYTDPAFVPGPGTPPPKNWSNYAIAVGEVVFIDAAIWAYDYAVGAPYVKISWDSVKQNFNKGWIVDTDDFWANSLMHPLHGNLTFNASRSLGLNFYESVGMSFIGSLVWEQFAEIQPASLNDQVNTPFGGSILGEALFRISRLILDSGGYDPSAIRQIAAFVVAPSAGLNRLMFGNKYRGPMLLPKSWLGEFGFGAVVTGSTKASLTAETLSQVGPWGSFVGHLVYGIPGTPGLELDKPFDHFEA